MFNPQPRMEIVPILPGESCVVLDDVLLEPERWVDQAARQAADFKPAPRNAYPGVELAMPVPVSELLREFFARTARPHLRLRRIVRAYSRLSMATLAPESLQPMQWLCHRDRPAADPGLTIAASVLYLFHDAELGGTNFYAPRQPETQIAQLLHDSNALDSEAFTRKYDLHAGYMTDSNAWFERVASVPARWNRMIFYSGAVFHSGDIRHPERLGTDPKSSRLTLNGFFTCKRDAA